MCTLCLNLSLKQQQMPCTLFPTCNMLSGGSLRQWGWIQRPTTKQLRGPTFLTFICKCKQPQWEWLMDSVKEEMEDWTKSLWSLQPRTFFCPHSFLFSSYPPSLVSRHLHAGVSNFSSLFCLQRDLRSPRLALQLYRDITKWINVVKIWEERCSEIMQDFERPWKH